MRNPPHSCSRIVSVASVAAALAVAASPSVGAPPSRLAKVAKTTQVQVGDFFFRRAKVQVKVGSTVRWTWIGMAGHNVTFPTLHRHSHTQSTGSYQLRFAKAGTYHYLCTIHGFTGVVVVK